MRGARFPGRYLQGPGVLARLGEEAAGFADRAVVLLDGGVFDRFAGAVDAALSGSVAVRVETFAGESTEEAVASLVRAAEDHRAGLIVGMGGGKALDTSKAAAVKAGLPMVVVPTIAASDAPCSALSIIYNDDGSVNYDMFLPRNPDLVLVDTTIIAEAPARFLAAGIGDALATWYEAHSCEKSGANNCMGMPGLPLAYAIARTCLETVWAYGPQALEECDAKTAGPALERIVEANILMSGLGFESGGVAAAHAIHHGLTELDEVHHNLHGEKVAVGILAGLLLNQDRDEFERVRAFLRSVRLPVTLADIGITDPTDEKLHRVARRACRKGEIVHNEPFPVTEAMVVAVLRELV